ncbi:MAG: deoxyribodipyrimidine photo-lyase [Actinomycetales bacterium]|nr:deoxyribodipyrimidine photo-lyase [Actinomycetales bacterium]
MSSRDATSIVWLRDDLRLADNPALRTGVDRGGPLVIVVIRDEESDGVRPLGGASRWWWHHSLAALETAIRDRGGALTLRTGPAEAVLTDLVAETGAEAVFWNRRYGPSRAIDARLKERLRDEGVEVASFAANLLHEPWEVRNGSGGPYRVFTPFWRAASALPVRELVPEPRELPPTRRIPSEALDDWDLLPTRPDWADGLRAAWSPGERGAHARMNAFARERLADYHRRDEPAVPATSGLSPHLRFGEISPVQLWHRVHDGDLDPAARRNVAKFSSELGWREFNHAILFENPRLATVNYRDGWDAFPWRTESRGGADLEAWRRGRTGVPLVDAGMRELWTTGCLHNRVRMVVASFLVKNLLIDWRVGERWFWDTLVDADEANNPGNWQWVAGTGADAAPYFRVFNPETQAKRFDPDAEYLRRWVPEYGTAEYPEPIVDLTASRREALDAYETVKKG